MGLCDHRDTVDRPTSPPERGLLHVWQSGGYREQLSPERVLLSRPVLQTALGENHGLLLSQGGLVYSFGELLWRGLSVPLTAPVLEVSLQERAVVRVAAGGFHCGVVTAQGSVYMWGENTAGQCVAEPCVVGIADSEVVPPAVVQVMDVACGREHSLALSSQNELWAWGSGCQLGLVTKTFPVYRPHKVEHLAGRHVIQVACGAYHSLALVRSLSQPLSSIPKPAEKVKRERRWSSGHSFVADKVEPSVVEEDSHYCPLGVELSDVSTGEVEVLYNEVSLCLQEQSQSLYVESSSSLSDIRVKTTEYRRRSLPGIPSHVKIQIFNIEARDRLPCLDTEVWSWGRGSEGQLGQGDQLARLQPLCIKPLTGEEVIKVAAGSHHSLAITANCQVYSWGSNMCGQLGHINSPVTVPKQAKLSEGIRVWDVSAGQSHSLLLADGDCVQPVLLYCGQQQEPKTEKCDTPQQGYISSIRSGGQTCTLLSDQNIMGFVSAIHELASRERQFYCWLSSVKKVLLTPLQSVNPCLGDPCTRLFFTICDKFAPLHLLIGQHSTALSYFLYDLQSCDVTSLPLITHVDHFLDTFKEYCSSVGDFQVMGGIVIILVTIESILINLCFSLPQLTVDYQCLHQGCGQFESLSSSLLKKKKEAETTCNFWKSYSGKTTEVLRLPHRRVVCESSHRNLTLQNAGRFSNHWFILFNDALVHTQFSTHHIYPLTCLWVKPVTEDDNGLDAIKIICPEENFTLVASTPQEKNKWLQALNQAVDQVLGGGGHGSLPGITAITRTASYTFTGEGRFKDAQYKGHWQAGRVHGRGTMKWPDGRTYTGNFKNGLEDGYGECLIPNKALNEADCYNGHWKDGQIHGFGKYKYATGEVYEGCFFEGQRHGYGMLSSGRLARSSSSVFIGQWFHDKKTGYGVYDDITSGQKYMGLWVDDQRHGNAAVVTQHGLYFEGTFKENKMSGSGLLVSDDDTTFHGEFSDDWTINGKVPGNS
uniref:PH domain-containing protein n=1 Tax=Periophthalmus magnuspinnatus TaxID=409849 RepID=A0A3B3ZMZ5_9GOBI